MPFGYKIKGAIREEAIQAKVTLKLILSRFDKINIPDTKGYYKESITADGQLILDGDPHGIYTF